MAAGDLALNILLSATDQASGIVGQVGKALSGLAGGGPLGAVAAVGAAAVGALVGVGAAAVKATGDFEQMTNTLVTSAGEDKKNLAMVRQGILDISVATGTSTDQLAGAMYMIESSGQRGADGLNVLKAAAQGAKAENADLTTVARALTTVLTDYHMPASQATQAMDGLIETVKHGQTNLEALSKAMGAVLPIASSLHVSFPQVAGSIATMTNSGMSAQQAAQNLAHVLVALSAPSKVAVSSMKDVGLSADQVKNALVNQGLPAALQLIEDHVGKKFPAGSVAYETALKNILGGIVGFKVAAMLTGDSLKTTEQNIKDIAAAMHLSAGAVAGFDVVQSSFNFKIAQAQQALQVLLIVLGQALLPVVGKVVGWVAQLIQQFIAWETKTHGIEKAIGAVGAVLTTVGAILSPVVKFIQNMVTAVTSGTGAFGDMQPVLKQIGDFLQSTFQPVWDQLVTTWKTQIVPAWNDFVKALQPAMPALQLIGKLLLGIIVVSLVVFIKALAFAIQGLIPVIGTSIEWTSKFIQAILWVVTQLQPAIQSIVNIFQSLYDDLVGHSIIPDLINGIFDWFSKIPNFLTNLMRQVVGFLVAQWNIMVNDVKAALKVIGTTIATAWNVFLQTPFGQLLRPITTWFATLATNFGTWAMNAMKMFGQNITAGISFVTTAVTNVANTIKKLLGFASPPQAGPLATSNAWMPNMMSMFASGITTNTPLVTNATNRLALTITTQFMNLNTNIKTNVAQINTQINLLNTNMQTATTNTNNQLNQLNNNVNTATQNINTQVQSVNNIVPPVFITVGKAATTAGQQVAQSGVQITTSTTQAGQAVDRATSSMKVSFGNTSQYSSQTVSVVDKNTQTINKNLDEMDKHNKKITDDITQAILNVSDNGIGNMQKFADAVTQMGMAAVNQAQADAAAIANMLGHSKPKIGPLRDDDQWGKHMVENIVGGMVSSMPLLTGATNSIANTLATVGLGPNATLSIGNRPLSSGQSAPLANQPIVIHNYTILDGRQVGKSVTKFQQNELRVQGSIRGI